MSNIKFRTKKIGTSAEAGAGAGYQFVTGPGIAIGLVADYAATADVGTVLTLRDGFNTSGDLLYTKTTATDFGTTVPVRLFQNGRLISGVSTDNVHAGLPFFDGLFVNIAADVAGPQAISVFYRPLIRKDVKLLTTGADGVAAGGSTLYTGPGLFVAARVVYDIKGPATQDLTFYDGISTSGRALTAIANSTTNWTASADESVVTTTSHDEAGTALTTAANAHENDGVLFYTGLHVAIAQTNAFDAAANVSALIEA